MTLHVCGHTHMYMYVPMETQGCHWESSLFARLIGYGVGVLPVAGTRHFGDYRWDAIYVVSGSPALANELLTQLLIPFLILGVFFPAFLCSLAPWFLIKMTEYKGCRP